MNFEIQFLEYLNFYEFKIVKKYMQIQSQNAILTFWVEH